MTQEKPITCQGCFGLFNHILLSLESDSRHTIKQFQQVIMLIKQMSKNLEPYAGYSPTKWAVSSPGIDKKILVLA